MCAEILHEMKYFSGICVFRPISFRLLPSCATVKMDDGENIKNACYATNDKTAGFIYQMKNRNTSRKTEYDFKLIKYYFASIGEIRKHNIMTLLLHLYKYIICHISRYTPES